jgi:hypothetical integral membrane protein (TIGR02206 family)
MVPFTFFGASHITVLCILIVGFFAIYSVRYTNTAVRTIVRWSIVSTLLLQTIIFHTWHITQGQYILGSYLPFHLCSVSLYLVVFSLIFKTPFLTNLTYYIASVSALLALLSPDVQPDQNFPSFRFMEFFISHIFILFGVWFMLVIDKIHITYRMIWYSFAVLFCYMLVIFPINYITNGNYLFLKEKPASGGLFALFPPEPYHILVLIPATFAVFYIEYKAYKLFAVANSDEYYSRSK